MFTGFQNRRLPLEAGFLAVLLLVLAASIWNFTKSIPFQLVDFDSFQYLAFSRSLLSGTEIYIPEIRSPFLALLIPSSLLWARFLMALFHVGTTLLIYLISRRLFENRAAALFAALAFGLSWWMFVFQTSPLSDLPGMFFFLAGLLFWLGGEKRGQLVSGVLFGLALLVRFDLIFLIAPLVFFTRPQHFWRVLLPAFLLAGPFEFLLDALAYGHLVYSPFEFFRVNVLQFGGTASKDFLRVGVLLARTFPLIVFLALFAILRFQKRGNRILLSLFVPFFLLASYAEPAEPRIFVVKLMPLLALLSANFFLVLKETSMKREVWQAVTAGLLIFVVGFGLLRLAGIQYEERKFEVEDCVSGRVCSNFYSAVEYYCGVHTQLVQPTLESVGELGKTCDSFVYFKDISFYDTNVNTYLQQHAELWGENTAAYVYRFR